MVSLRLDSMVRLLIAAQVMVATVLLALGETHSWLPAITLTVLVVSAYVTDSKQWVILKQPLADLLALGVVAMAAISAYQADRQGLLVAVANLQSYLQYVVLFQRKSPRVYWQLALLSLGQVAIASALVPGPAFGIFLLVYLFVAMLGFAALLLYVESGRLVRRGGNEGGAMVAPAARARRPVIHGEAVPIDARQVVRGLVGPAASICLVTVVCGGLLFFFLPRWETSEFRVNDSAQLRTVGFSNTVLLGELGEVVDNSDLVMRIQFFRGRGNTPIQLDSEPLLRGTVLTRYEDRKWSRSFRSNPVALPTEPRATFVRQAIKVEPLDVNELFCVFPVFAMEQPPNDKLRINTASDQLIRLEEYRSQSLEFEVGTTGIIGNRQREIIPAETPVRRNEMRLLLSQPGDQFTGLQALAAGIMEELGVDPAQDPVSAARALSDYFHVSNEFFYSQTAQDRDEQLDPLEDFVTSNRSGHCEYFAGALVLMLRSLGIPARMAIGFKGGEWNPLGMYYQVQQLHAHAWVEAYLPQDQIPPDELSPEDAPFGAWLILDPTEGTREESESPFGSGLLARVRQSIDYAQVLWINYVASLNPKRQHEGIYEPLAAGLDAAIDNLTSRQVWQRRLDTLEESRAGRFWAWYRRHWFSWRGGVVAMVFSLVLVGAFLAVRSLAPLLLARGWFARRRRGNRGPVLEMYRRLETALRRAGLVRQPAQTAREFALAAGGQLANHLEYRTVADLPLCIVERFYAVRFGGRALDSDEAQAVEQALRQLELTLARRR